MRRHEYPVALLLQLIGSAGALLVAVRTWQTVTTPRPAPLHEDVLSLTGRTVDAAPTALALVALAGVVAVVATRGVARRVVGALVALAGAALVWRAIVSAAAVGTARARTLVTGRHRTVDADAVVPRVEVHGLWPVLTVVCGLLILVAGALVAARGHRWRSLSSRYEQPATAADAASSAASAASSAASPADEPRSPTAPALWTALDRGDDPTVDGPDPADEGAEGVGDGPGDPGAAASRYPRD